MTERDPRSGLFRIVPLASTIAAHGLLALLIGTLAIGSFALHHSGDEGLDAVLAEMPRRNQPVPTPQVQSPPTEAETPVDEPMNERLAERLAAPTPAMQEQLAERLRDRLAAGATPTTASTPLAEGSVATVTFIGVRADRASSVAYVVDASGSLVSTLPLVIDELQRSLDRLTPGQRFGVVFFQRNGAVIPPGGDGLQPAAPKVIREEIAWIRENVRPSGRSNPLKALETALSWKPDVVFVLSTNITGSGEFEISRDDLLDRVEALNPIDSTGTRRTRIRCIQFLDPDPLDTLRLLAERHGGANGFRFLSREELGLTPDHRTGKSAPRPR
ncbi:MAG: hypothetical protein U0572_08500 [Phycisphaerales bacterium]